ncbi:MAG: type II toxin-antitoxin system Phd/YefM family antitoxin [Defluviitaleaceae bacterium]|nr:type II toxin-antitoxin system Phd/YefM family antitoxin [Defluviitaleaceae bacterium]
MVVTATDLKTNLGKYLDLLDTEDIIVTRNGRKIARLIRDEEDVLAEVQSLYGILSVSEGDEKAEPKNNEERVRRYDRIDWYQRNS